MSMADFLKRTVLGNTYLELAVACLTVVLCTIAMITARRIARRNHARIAEHKRADFLEIPLQVLSRTRLLFIGIFALFLGASTLDLPRKVDRAASTVLTIVFFWQLGVWVTSGLAVYLDQRRRAAIESDRAAIGSLGIISFVGRVLVWVLVTMMVLDNLGVDVTALVAGLGVGGIAVALAVQNVLGDLFASLSITLDRPFMVGDFLVVGEYMGTVEHIGIKSVRLRSLSGEQIVMANADVLGSRVRNYGRMAERRVVFSFSVSRETPRKLLRKLPDTLRQIISAHKDVRFDRSHFSKFGDYALEFETVYYVLSADYNQYMDIQQAIYFCLHEALERDGISLAYPTRTLWMHAVRDHDETTNGPDSEAPIRAASTHPREH
jgi:small-conductance mechanosensitive channel